jgi:pimeloyl-ACP methyl ester carboxylesterase
MVRIIRPLLVAGLVLAGCADATTSGVPATSAAGANSQPASEVPATGSISPSSTPDPLAEPSLRGTFAVDDEGRELAITCWGQQEPTIIIEGGDPDGRDNFGGTSFVRALVSGGRVCLYDRAGGGDSDPAPNEKRDVDDVADDLHALLAAARVDGPKVLVGSSFGGALVANYAARHSEDVVGVVLIDVSAPEVFTAEEFPGGAWDYPGNVEHIDLLTEHELAPFDASLLVITASDGDSSVDDQRFFLRLSPDSRQVELRGGHDLHEEHPGAVAAEIISFIRAAMSSGTSSFHHALLVANG